MTLETGRIHQGDCIELLAKLDAGHRSFGIRRSAVQHRLRIRCLPRPKSIRPLPRLDAGDWMSGIVRVLKPDGTFWLAIGDEYAAELKLIAQDLGFSCRSWVIWYYTFGVNCTRNSTARTPICFTSSRTQGSLRSTSRIRRSACHLPAVGLRRQASQSKGRLPDDTWILRPQDVPDGFSEPKQDTWYFPRVAGTFKERAGFHGCQMPEQLLGRIIRASSNEGRFGSRSVYRQRHNVNGREETQTRLDWVRAFPRVCTAGIGRIQRGGIRRRTRWLC